MDKLRWSGAHRPRKSFLSVSHHPGASDCVSPKPLINLYLLLLALCLTVTEQNLYHLTMAPSVVLSPGLEQEDHARDAAFNSLMHGKSFDARGGLMALRGKDAASQKAALDEYFKHWDNKAAAVETEEVRKARRDEYATLTRQ